MAAPFIINLDTSSDVRFRDIVGRDQSQVATSGNLIRKSHHRISAGQYNAWTTRTTNNLQYRDVTYANNVFVAVAASASSMTSSDGMTWTLHSGPSGSWQGIAYGNGLFVSVSSTGSTYRVRTSPDGSTWTTQTSPVDGDWISVTYGDGLFVAVANTGNSRIMTSPDGQNWTTRTAPAAHSWYDVAYGNGLFVAVSTSGTGDRVMTSPDGITWTLRSTPADNGWTSVTYGNGLFVAVAWTGTGDGVMTSPDGIVWTLRTSAADNAWRGVGYGAGLFVAVSFTGVGNRVMTSPDGIVWTSRTSPADNPWSAVAFGNGMFVAVASSGDNDRAMSSPWDAGVMYVPAAEVVSMDAGNNAQFDLLLSTPAAPLTLANITAANIATWSSNNSILSLRQGTTTLRSANVVVGQLTANTITGNLASATIAPGGVAKLDNCIIRSFQKTLGATAGNASEICTISNTNEAFTSELHVVQSESAGASIAKMYSFTVRTNATANAWRRLVPLSSSSSTNWGVEIRVGTTTTTLRLVRQSGSTTTNLECTLTLYQSRADPVTISPSATSTTGITFASTLYENTLVTQVGGKVGIGTDNPTDPLTVMGRATVDSMVATHSLTGYSVGAPGRFYDTTPLVQGAYMSWNSWFGSGRTDFISKRGAAAGGFQFYLSSGSGTSFATGKTLLGNINASGISLAQGTFAAPGSIVGSLFLSGRDQTGGVSINPSTISRFVNGSDWVTVATINYTPKSTSSRIFMYFDVDYTINGSGGDGISSGINVDGLATYLIKSQWLDGGTGGTGTRSCTIFPISNVVKNTSLATRSIVIQVNMASIDDTLSLLLPDWKFELLERQT